LSEDNKCKIYHLRPVDCKLFPFSISLENKRFLWVLYKCAAFNFVTGKMMRHLESTCVPLFTFEELKEYADMPHDMEDYVLLRELSPVTLAMIKGKGVKK